MDLRKGQPEQKDLKVKKMLEECMVLIDDHTQISIVTSSGNLLSHGNWYDSKVLQYMDATISRIVWESNNSIRIELM